MNLIKSKPCPWLLVLWVLKVCWGWERHSVPWKGGGDPREQPANVPLTAKNMSDILPQAKVICVYIVPSFMSGEIVDDVLGMPCQEKCDDQPEKSGDQGK